MNKLTYLKDEIYLSFKSLINLGLAFIILTLYMIGYVRNINITSLDLILNSFMGPLNLQSGAIVILAWFSYKTLIIFYVGNYFDKELNERLIFNLFRFGSRTKWILTRFIHIFILIVLYNLICFISIFLLSLISLQNKLSFGFYTRTILQYNNFNPLTITINMFILIVLSTFLMSLIFVSLRLLSKNNILPFSVLQLLILLSIMIIDINMYKYLPESQSILIKHNIKDFNFAFSYLYNLVLIGLLVFLCVTQTKKSEI